MSFPNAVQIFGENRVSYALLGQSSGAGTIENIRDRKYGTKWQSVGSSDAAEEYVDVFFKDKAGNYASYDFDRIILLNTNAKTIRADYYANPGTGPGTPMPGASVINNDKPDCIISLGALPVTPYGVGLYLHSTQVPNQNKFLGELKVCKHILSLSALTQFQRQDYAKEGNYYTRNGDLVRWREFRKFGGQLTLQNVSQAQRDALWAAYESYDFFVFCFFSDFALSETYDVAITAPPSEVFNRTTQLYGISLEVKER